MARIIAGNEIHARPRTLARSRVSLFVFDRAAIPWRAPIQKSSNQPRRHQRVCKAPTRSTGDYLWFRRSIWTKSPLKSSRNAPGHRFNTDPPRLAGASSAEQEQRGTLRSITVAPVRIGAIKTPSGFCIGSGNRTGAPLARDAGKTIKENRYIQ